MFHKHGCLALALCCCMAAVAWATDPQPPAKLPAFLGVRFTIPNNRNLNGAQIVHILKGTAAASSKLQIGDVITSVDGDSVDSYSDLVDKILDMPAGKHTSFTVVRGDKQFLTKVTLGARPRYYPELSNTDPPLTPAGSIDSSGMTFESDFSNSVNLILRDKVTHVVGSFSQDWTGLMAVDLDKPSSLEVTGNVDLGGILYVGMKERTPQAGDKFEVIQNAASIKGSFGKIIYPDLPEGLHWSIVYDNLPRKLDLDGDGKCDVTLVVEEK